MSGTVTNPRIVAGTAVAIDWQDSEGEAVSGPPYTPRQFLVVQSLSRDVGASYLHPQGTHGSIFKRKDGERIVSQAFKKSLKLWGSKMHIAPFLESVMGGVPTCAFADLTVTGGSTISALSFTGIRPHHNTAPYVSTPPAGPSVYISLTASGGPAFPVTANFYRDAARTLLVGTCSVAGAATPTTITESNNSGLTGSITLSSPLTQTPVAALVKINYAFAIQHARYFRMYYCDGPDTFVMSDCVCSELTFDSSENGELSLTAEVMGRRRQISEATVLTVPETQLDLVSYSHSELTLTKDPTGTPVLPVVDSFSFHIKNDVLQYIGNAATPQALIKRGWVDIGGNFKGEPSDELEGLLTNAQANTAVGGGYIRMKAEYLLEGKTLLLEMLQAKPIVKYNGVAGDQVEKVDLDYEAHYDGATTPVNISMQV